MPRSVRHATLATLLAFAVGCAPETSNPPTDAGTTADAGQTTNYPDSGPTVDGGPSCPPAYPTASLGGLDCDPLVPSQCGFPLPSNVYLTPNSASETCFNVNFGATTLPILNTSNTDPSAWSDSDGWSPGTSAVTYLPGASATGLPDQNHIGSSVAVDSSMSPTSPTILLDTSTTPPSLVPHFAEIDQTDPSTSTDQALLIHPAIRLKDNTRYIVAVRNVVTASGAAIAPSPTFQALRDGTAAPTINVNGTMMTDPSVAARTTLYANIFSELAAANISKSTLQIAWDYTTASKTNNVGQLESMYEQALAAIPSTGPDFTVVSSVDNPDALTARRVRGLISVPLFLNNAQVNWNDNPLNPDLSTGYIMNRNNGVPVMNGFGQFEFIVNIPKSATTSITPYPILIQGHGLFSDRSEGQDALATGYDNTVLLAQNQGYVTVALDLLGWRTPGFAPFWQAHTTYQSGTDVLDPNGNQWKNVNAGTSGSTAPSWPNPQSSGQTVNDGTITWQPDSLGWPLDWGVAGDTNQENDQAKAVGFVSEDIGHFRRMIDRGTQGMLNQLIAVKMMETSFANSSLAAIGPGEQSVIDPTRAYYRGDSQGGILGITFMALTRDCLRGYLGEAGMPYNLLLLRSTDFGTFLQALIGNYPNPNPSNATANPAMNVQVVLELMQMFWDRLEGDGFAPYITASPISPETPAHHIFMADALGDHQVTPLGTHILARTVGAYQLNPGIRELYGISDKTDEFSGDNALQEFDFGILTDPNDTVPQVDTPPTGPDDPHDWVRLTQPSYLETDEFLKTGVAVDFCGDMDGGTPAATPTNCTFPLGAP
jgi:hypothetical protein